MDTRTHLEVGCHGKRSAVVAVLAVVVDAVVVAVVAVSMVMVMVVIVVVVGFQRYGQQRGQEDCNILQDAQRTVWPQPTLAGGANILDLNPKP